jgi:hypothetical protein
MDLVAHCGDVNRGSYVHSLVLTDIASGWTECAPLIVRESTLLVETLDRVRLGLPFSLRALDVDNGGEFLNETMIQYCLRNGRLWSWVRVPAVPSFSVINQSLRAYIKNHSERAFPRKRLLSY